MQSETVILVVVVFLIAGGGQRRHRFRAADRIDHDYCRSGRINRGDGINGVAIVGYQFLARRDGGQIGLPVASLLARTLVGCSLHLDDIIFIGGGRSFAVQNPSGHCDLPLQYQRSVINHIAFAGQEGSLVVACCWRGVRRDHGSDRRICHAGCGVPPIVTNAKCYADPGNGGLVHGGNGKCRVVTKWPRAVPTAPCPVIGNSRFACTHRHGIRPAFSSAFVRASF